MPCNKMFCLVDIYVLVHYIPMHWLAQATQSNFSLLTILYPHSDATSCKLYLVLYSLYVSLFSVSTATILVLDLTIFRMSILNGVITSLSTSRLPESSSHITLSFLLLASPSLQNSKIPYWHISPFTIDMHLYLCSCFSCHLYFTRKSL